MENISMTKLEIALADSQVKMSSMEVKITQTEQIVRHGRSLLATLNAERQALKLLQLSIMEDAMTEAQAKNKPS